MSKSLVKNSFFNVIYQLLNVLFPLVTAPYIARILLPDNVGKVAIAQNWAQYFIVFAALGIPTYAIREIAKSKHNKAELNHTFTELFSINFISTTISVVAYLITIFSFNNFRQNIMLYLAVGLGILFNYITIDWLYQGLEDYGYIAIRSFIVKLLSLLALLILVRSKNDYVLYALISACAIGCNNIFNILHLSQIGVKFNFNHLSFSHHIKPIIIFFTNSITVKLYTLINVTLLGILSTDAAAAFYTNSDKVVRLIVATISAIGGVLLPRFSVYAQRGEKEKCADVASKVFHILFFLFVPTCLGLILMSKEIVLILFGSQYTASIPTLQIMSLLLLSLGFNGLFGTILLAFGHERENLLCPIAGALTCLIFNFALIPTLAQNGAAIACVVAESVVTGVAVFFSSRIIKLHFRADTIAKTIIAAIGMGAIVMVFKLLIHNLVLCLLASVGFGMLCYIVLSWCMHNPELYQLLTIIRRKQKR